MKNIERELVSFLRLMPWLLILLADLAHPSGDLLQVEVTKMSA
jgi:hypothetical protein